MTCNYTKARYRVGNGSTCNAALINRRNVTKWIDEAALAGMPEAEPTRGRPRLSSTAPIQALVGIKTVLRLPLRALPGLAQSLGPTADLRHRTRLNDIKMKIHPSGSKHSIVII
nr:MULTISPECIES: transposase [Burkholderia]